MRFVLNCQSKVLTGLKIPEFDCFEFNIWNVENVSVELILMVNGLHLY